MRNVLAIMAATAMLVMGIGGQEAWNGTNARGLGSRPERSYLLAESTTRTAISGGGQPCVTLVYIAGDEHNGPRFGLGDESNGPAPAGFVFGVIDPFLIYSFTAGPNYTMAPIWDDTFRSVEITGEPTVVVCP